MVERLYDVLAILLIFFAAEPWLPQVSWFGAAAVAAIVLAALIAAAAIVLAVYGDRPVHLLLRPLRRHSRFSGERLERMASSSATVSAGCATGRSRSRPSCGRSRPGCSPRCARTS